jgi:hypothetical protein
MVMGGVITAVAVTIMDGGTVVIAAGIKLTHKEAASVGGLSICHRDERGDKHHVRRLSGGSGA